MTNFEQINMSCLSQYTVTVSGGTFASESAKMKNNFNNTPSMHEIDEEDDDEDCTEDCSRNATLMDSKQIEERIDHADDDKNNDACDNESTYSADSFCSDISYQETEEINAATTKSQASRPTSPLNLEENDADAEQEDDVVSAELENIDYESYITGSLENLTSSEKFGSTKCKRRNMSFTDEEMRRIERENELLLRKIMAQHRPRNKPHPQIPQQPRISSSAINRKKMQRKIEGDNMILLRRIQQAKSRVMTNTTAAGYRLTIF